MTSILRALPVSTLVAALSTAALPAAANVGYHPNDPLFPQQWSLEQPSDADIDAPEAWALLNQIGVNKEVVFAVVDGGYDLNHEDLREILWTNPGEIPGNGLDDDANGYIDDVHGFDFVSRDGNPEGGGDTHGSAVAGVVSAQANNNLGIAGIAAPAGVRVMLLRAEPRTAVEAWDYARVMGADVVNNSWGAYTQGIDIGNYVTWDRQLKEASARLDAADVVQTFAAGYTLGPWPDVWDDYNFPGVMRVSWSDQNDKLVTYFQSHANPQSIEIVAPSGVPSTGVHDQYYTFGGTSSAAPHAAGVAVLLRAAFPQLTNGQVVNAIMKGVDVPSPDYALYSRSGGRLNAHKALLEAQRMVAGG